MKKEFLGRFILIFSILCLFTNNLIFKCVGIIGIAVAFSLLSYFDKVTDTLGIEFNKKRKIILVLGTIILPVLYQYIFEFSLATTFHVILIYWLFMFTFTYIVSLDDNYNNDNKTENVISDKQNKNIDFDDNGFKLINSLDEIIYKKEYTDKYVKPELSLLRQKKEIEILSEKEINNNKKIIKDEFNELKINVDIKDVKVGHKVTNYEVSIPKGCKISEIVSLKKELEYKLKAKKIDISPTEKRGIINIEVNNAKVNEVCLRKLLENNDEKKYYFPLGVNKNNIAEFLDFDESNILIAGTTGYGKTNLINQIIISGLIKYSPEELRFILIDPGKAELSLYNGIPNLIGSTVTINNQVQNKLKKVESLIQDRANLFKKCKVSKINSYNEYAKKNGIDKLSYIYVIIDGYDIIENDKLDNYIKMLILKSKDYGVRFILSVQNPLKINKNLKSNFDSSMVFDISTIEESNYLLDIDEAIRIDEIGTMIYKKYKAKYNEKIYVPYVSYDEIVRVVNSIKENNKLYKTISIGAQEDSDDSTFRKIVDYSIKKGHISKQVLQDKFSLNNSKSKKTLKRLEELGIVDKNDTSNDKKVLYKYKKSEKRIIKK